MHALPSATLTLHAMRSTHLTHGRSMLATVSRTCRWSKRTGSWALGDRYVSCRAGKFWSDNLNWRQTDRDSPSVLTKVGQKRCFQTTLMRGNEQNGAATKDEPKPTGMHGYRLIIGARSHRIANVRTHQEYHIPLSPSVSRSKYTQTRDASRSHPRIPHFFSKRALGVYSLSAELATRRSSLTPHTNKPVQHLCSATLYGRSQIFFLRSVPRD